MRAYRIIIAIVIVLLLSVAPIVADESSADVSKSGKIYNFTGTTVLTEDLILDEQCEVNVSNGAVIDLKSYSLKIGEKSVVTALGAFTIESDGGKIIFGDGSSLVLLGMAVPLLREETEITFEGTLSSSYGSGMTVTFVPAGEDHGVHTVQGYRTLTLNDPVYTFGKVSGGLEMVAGFSTAVSVDRTYDGETLLATKTTEYIPDDVNRCYDIIFSLNGAEVKSLDIKDIIITAYYEKTQITRTVSILNMDPTDFTISGSKVCHITTGAETVVLEQYTAGNKDWDDIMKNLAVSVDVDPAVVSEYILYSNDTKVDLLRMLKLRIDVETSDTIHYNEDKERHLTDISIIVDASDADDSFFVMNSKEGNVTHSLTASEAEISTLSLSRQLVLDLEAVIPEMQYRDTEDGKVIRQIDGTNLDVTASDFDLKNFYFDFCETGQFKIRYLLDNSNILRVEADSISIDFNGDGSKTVNVNGLFAQLNRDGREMDTLTARFSDCSMVLPDEDGTLTAEIGSTQLYMFSNGTLTECIDALVSDIEFTDDAHTEIQLTNAGFRIGKVSDDGYYEVSSRKLTQSSPATSSLTMAVDYSTYLDRTTVSGKLSMIGYSLKLITHTDHTDPEGATDIAMDTDGLSGSFDLILGDEVSFTVGMSIPLMIDLTYYDIATQIDCSDLTLSLSHGILDVKDYDSSKEGVVTMIKKLKQNDFRLDTRAQLSAGTITIYQDGRSVVFNEFSDVEIESRNAALDLKREEMLDIAFTKLHFSLVDKYGELLSKSWDHMDFSKDLSGREEGKSFLEENAYYLMLIFSVASVILFLIIVYYRIKRPELYRFND